MATHRHSSPRSHRRWIALTLAPLLALGALTVAASPSGAATDTFAYAGPPRPIPDGNFSGAGTAIAVNTDVSGLTGPITDVKIRFPGSGCSSIPNASSSAGLEHFNISDLRIVLQSPDGTTVRLKNDGQGTGGDFCKTLFSDDAATSIASGSTPFTGSFRPDRPLSAFDGEDGNGIWRLIVRDYEFVFSGQVNHYSLIIETEDSVAPTLTGPGSATGEVGQSFTYTPTLTGSPDPTVDLRPNSDALPAGLSLDHDTGVISGTPEPGTGGEYAIKLRATNSAGSDNKNLQLTINEAPHITGAGSATGSVGDPFTYTPTSLTGSPAPTVDLRPNSDALPAGLSLDHDTGVISGTPEPGTGGEYAIKLQANNSVGFDKKNLDLTINDSPHITGPATATGSVGDPFTYTPTMLDGYPPPEVVVRATSDPLPAGLSLDPSTGVISGTPEPGTGGEYAIKLAARNGINPNDQLDIALTITDSPHITGPATATGSVGDAFTYTPTSLTGFPPPEVVVRAISDPLPAGLSLDPSTGVISGTPEPGTGGEYAIKLAARNGINPNDQLDIALTINEAPILTGPATATGKVGDPFMYTPTVLDGFPPPTVTLSAGPLPGGLSLDPDTGVISGTPGPADQHGTFPITLTADNGIDPPATLDVTLVIDKDDVEGLNPTISGLAQQGQTLTADAGGPFTPPNVRLKYRWKADGVRIPGETGPTLKLTRDEVGQQITVTIKANARDYNPQVKTSDPTPTVRKKVNRPRLDTDSNRVAAGDTVGIVGQGFHPGNTYQVLLQFTPIGTVSADQYGEINDDVTIPAGTPHGNQVLTLLGSDPSFIATSVRITR